MLTEAIGWASSAILLATLIRQILKEHRARPGEKPGVSNWLFIGQTLASIGFVTYSALVGNTVFVVTNSLILVTAIVGYVLHRQREKSQAAQ